MAKLIFTHEKFLGQCHTLAQGQTTVGRGGQNALVIPDSSVSVEHCLILTNGTEVLIRDQSSANGTFIDEIRVQGQQPIKSGQRLRFGGVTTRLELQPEDEGMVNDEITAVRAHSRALQQAQQPAQPTNPHVKLHTDAPSDPEGPTVRVAAVSSPSTPSRPEPRSPQAQPAVTNTPSSKLWLILGGAILAILTIAVLFALSRLKQ